MEKNIVDAQYCSIDYERCRLRASVLSWSSLLLFLYAIFILGVSIFNISESYISHFLTQSPLAKELTQQFSWVYILIAALLLFHFARIYFSLLMLDEDPFFYQNTLLRINPFKYKRISEWIVRLFLFICLGLILKTSTASGFAFSISDWSWFIRTTLIFYGLLICWDILMLKFLPYNLFKPTNAAQAARSQFFLSDTLGLIILMALVYIENTHTLKTGNIIGISVVIALLASISFTILFLDFRKNFKHQYWKHLCALLPKAIPCASYCPPALVFHPEENEDKKEEIRQRQGQGSKQ
jgi:hypothetical protein